ncbi:hypothetical protein CBR_g30788 [Chara braunii]|uniref:Reverse transcriptase domain-containing protein n=1 Tax=Chara braunii TaxID=69332 RepID=A0A388JXG5_CHABU|nr:hypothetical protein CBR_g30788 [Chara braunii]|eukprot:GBG62467.1 hypothetical protein CBR_g30788 [Chara braunii]
MNMAFQNFVRKTRLAQSIINYCVIVYMDDILVFSSSYEGHVQHIEWTLHALKDAGFKVVVEKCQFFLTEISFLGHVVTDQGLQPEPQKVTVVKDAPVPTSVTQVRAFLGLVSYYRRFIKGFAAIAGPLTNLLKKDQSLIWTPQRDRAFRELKAALISAPVLIRPDAEKPFVLIIDWQPEAVSAILAQVGPDDLEYVVEYASKSVSSCKRNYSGPRGECYAALWGISHFRAYLYGRKFTLVTDHEPLLALKKSKDYSGMIGRWARPTTLQSMDFDIRHRKHEKHGKADGLTQLHRPDKLWPKELTTDDTLVGLLCGEIAKGGRATVADELLTFLSQLIDDLPTDIISYNPSDLTQAEPVTLQRKLTPTVIWANCTEDYGQYLSDHDPMVWLYLDLDELAPDNSDFDEFWKAHRENGELSSDDNPGRIAIVGLSEEEESKARSTSKEEEEALAPEPQEAPPARALPAVRGAFALNPAVPSDAPSRHDGATTSR